MLKQTNGEATVEFIKGLNAVVAFGLELVMYYAVGLWGYSLGNHPLGRWLLAIGLPLVVVGVWAVWAAPNASTRLSQPGLFIFEAGLQLLAAGLLYLTGHRAWALGFAGVVVVSQLLAAVLHQS
jgi:hypothetical protein